MRLSPSPYRSCQSAARLLSENHILAMTKFKAESRIKSDPGKELDD